MMEYVDREGLRNEHTHNPNLSMLFGRDKFGLS